MIQNLRNSSKNPPKPFLEHASFLRRCGNKMPLPEWHLTYKIFPLLLQLRKNEVPNPYVNKKFLTILSSGKIFVGCRTIFTKVICYGWYFPPFINTTIHISIYLSNFLTYHIDYFVFDYHHE